MLPRPSLLKTRKPFNSHVSDTRALQVITNNIPIGGLGHHDRGRCLLLIQRSIPNEHVFHLTLKASITVPCPSAQIWMRTRDSPREE